MNNGHQLMAALQLYAADYSDWLPPNPEDSGTNRWVGGKMNVPEETTNVVFLTDPTFAKLAPYAGRSAAIYKCPSDKSTVSTAGASYARVRTFSMSQAVGTKPTLPEGPVDGPWLDGTRLHVAGHPWKTYGKFSTMDRPSPAELWVFLDEDEHLINDAAFAVAMTTPTQIIDWPGIYHGFSCGFAFADGHSEIHRWKDPRTRIPSNYLTEPADYLQHKIQPENSDITWLQRHTSARAQVVDVQVRRP